MQMYVFFEGFLPPKKKCLLWDGNSSWPPVYWFLGLPAKQKQGLVGLGLGLIFCVGEMPGNSRCIVNAGRYPCEKIRRCIESDKLSQSCLHEWWQLGFLEGCEVVFVSMFFVEDAFFILSLRTFGFLTEMRWHEFDFAGEMSELCVLAAATLQIHFDVGERAKSLHAAVSTFKTEAPSITKKL